MGKKGGSSTQTTKVELDPEIKKAALANLGIADSVASLGATPYNGPSIAGFSPQQMAAMQGVDQAAAAFGMPSAVNWQQGQGGAMQAPRGMSNADLFKALTGMPAPNSSAGGFSGYNTAPIGQAAFNSLPPAQRALIQSFTMNPVTGAMPTNSTVPSPKHQVTVSPSQGRTPKERAAIARQNEALAEAARRNRLVAAETAEQERIRRAREATIRRKDR